MRDGGKCNLSPSDGGDSVPKFVFFLDRDGCCYREYMMHMVKFEGTYLMFNVKETMDQYGDTKRTRKSKNLIGHEKLMGNLLEKQGSRDNDDFIPINCVFSTKGYNDCVFRRCIVSKFRYQFANQKRGPWYKNNTNIRKKTTLHWSLDQLQYQSCEKTHEEKL